MPDAITTAVCQSTGSPFSAIFTAGMTRSRQRLVPNSLCASASSAGCVGAISDLAPVVLILPFTSGHPKRLPTSNPSLSS